MKNYYEILEVHKRASDEVIERAYKTLVMKYHPDKYRGDCEYANQKMLDLNEAYTVLSDVISRERYDREFEEYEFEQIAKKRSIQDKKNGETKGDNNEGKPSEESKYQVGTMASMIGLTSGVFKGLKNRKKIEKLDKQSGIAIILTILIILVVGVLLWFIPFTNNFIRSVTVDNPMISWMF